MTLLSRLFILILLSIVTTVANAQCGLGFAGCGGTDNDGDGVLSANDCDDSASGHQMYPGIWRFNAGQYSQCLNTGLYSAGTAIPLGATGPGQNFFIDCDAGVNGTGSHGSPWNTLRQVSSMTAGNRPIGWRNLIAGDAVWIAGTCDEEIDHDGNPATAQTNFYLNAIPGTLANPVTIRTWPGRARAKIESLVDKQRIVMIENSSYVDVTGLEVTGTATQGFNIVASNNVNTYNLFAHKVYGSSLNNNIAGVVFNGANNSSINNSDVSNNYALVFTQGQTANMRNIVAFQGTGNKVKYSHVYMSEALALTANDGACIGYKHPDAATTTSATFQAKGNIVTGCAVAIETSQAGSNLANNYLVPTRTACMTYRAIGGFSYLNNALFENNTCIGLELLAINGNYNDSVVGGNVIRDNVHVANASGYTFEVATINNSTYGDNTIYDQHVVPGAFNYSGNCYFNQGAAPLQFNLFASDSFGNKGRQYNFTEWKLADTVSPHNKPAYDVTSFNENPILTPSGVATSTNCSSKGWKQSPVITTLFPTVNYLTTAIPSPALSGSLGTGSLTATVSVTVNGNTYVGVNNGDGTWSLAAGGISPALAVGVYNVSVTVNDGLANGSDLNGNELTIIGVTFGTPIKKRCPTCRK